MNAERLLAHYARIADALEAILRLRRFVLDLAVRGKLVPQDLNDEPASELLNRIAAEKARMVKAGEISKPKPLSPLEDRELPFGVPVGWAVAPLDELSPRSLSDGDWIETKDQSVNGGVRLIQLADVGVGEFLNKSARFVTEETEVRLNCTRLAVGDVLIARLPNPIGRACIFPDIGQPAITAVDVAILRPDSNVSGDFLVLAMNSPPIREQIEAYGKGATRFRVSTGHLKTVQIPLPPLAEQHRIVAKVDELMALCDRLEAARAKREATRDRFTAASLARLNAPDPDTFRDDARFAFNALPALAARADQIKQLRQTILSLAVVGKLTASTTTGASASTELDAVKAKKEQLNLKKPRAIVPISLDEHWCELPNGWVWARWDQITDWITYGFTRPMPHTKDGVPIITGKNVNQGKIIFETADRTPTSSYQELNEKDRPKRGDILITKDGSIGRTAIVDSDEPFCINQSVAVLWLRSCHFDRRFLQLTLDCPQTQQSLLAKTEGVAIKHISIIDLGKMVFPVPPIAEQRRVVARVDELMTLCGRLEASLTTADETRRRLLEALLAQALAPGGERELEAAE